MQTSSSHKSTFSSQRALAIALTTILALGTLLSALAPHSAFGITSAEKRAEADAVYAQIDSLQTSLNEAMAQHAEAEAAHTEAVQLSEEAARQIKEETERIERLQDELSDFAVGMYKDGSTGNFLDVMLQTTSFEDFLTSWDFCSSISNQGTTLIQESKTARQNLEIAKQTYDEQTQRAEEQMAIAESTMQQITDTQEALRVEAAKITAEAAELQAQEELAAEAARQAEEARVQQEAALAGGTYSPGASVLSGSGTLNHPCPGAYLSSSFGYRTFDNSFHKGIDLAASEGTPYYAADSGTVMYATNNGSYNGGAGNWVVISHGNGIVTKYMHSSAVYVSPGQYVERGQNIGAVGNTGNSFGAHLHFQVEAGGVAVNPLNYI